MERELSSACPEQQELVELLAAPESVGPTLELHIDTCADCQQVLAVLSDSDSLRQLRPFAQRGADLSHGLDPPLFDGDLGSIGDVAIEVLIGRGGMGDVFKGRDESLGRTVAIKILGRGSSPQADYRFEREARALAQLDHPNIVSVYSTGRLKDGRPWLLMPFVEGKTLKEKIKEGELDVKIAAEIVMEVAQGLSAAHDAGLLHRDVKPANILLDAQGSSPRLADFGLVRTLDGETLTQADVVCGTPEYISPEQIDDTTAFDQRSDVYSLGITLYESLTGTPPFRGQPIQILEQHRNTVPIPLRALRPLIPADLQNVCLMAMAKEPQRRYQSVRQFAEDLQRFLSGVPVLARETTSVERLGLWCKRNPVVAGLSATSIALLLLLAVGSSVAAWRLNKANHLLALEKKNVETAEKMAVIDRNAAVGALNSLVDSVYRDLTNDAASIKTREHVANAAIQGLKSLTEVEGDRPIDRSYFLAHLHLADLTSLKGDPVDAESFYDSAIEIATSILNHDPDNTSATLDLADAVGKFAAHLAHLGDARAVETTDRSLSLLESIGAKNGGLARARSLWLTMQGQKLELVWQQKPTEFDLVIKPGKELLAEFDDADPAAENDPSTFHARSKINFIVGRSLLDSHRSAEAQQRFEESRRLLDKSLASTPNNIQLEVESAILDRALGMAIGAQGKLADSIGLFESALATQVRLSAAYPDDQAQKRDAANTRSILAMAYQFSGDFGRAIEQYSSTISDYQDIASSTSEDYSTRMLIVGSRIKLAEVQMLANKWEDARGTISHALSEFNLATENRKLDRVAANYQALLTISDEILTRLDGGEPNAETDTGLSMALYWAARRDATASASLEFSDQTREVLLMSEPNFEGSTFEDLFKFIRNLKGNDPAFSRAFPIYEARVFGVLASTIGNSQLANKQPLFERSRQQCFETIEKVASAMPNAVADVVLNDPDLIFIRQTMEFELFWNRIIQRQTAD